MMSGVTWESWYMTKCEEFIIGYIIIDEVYIVANVWIVVEEEIELANISVKLKRLTSFLFAVCPLSMKDRWKDRKSVV